MTISECVALAAKEAELITDIYFKCRNQQSIIAVSLVNSCKDMENAEDIFKTIKDMAADNLQAITDILGEEILNRVYEL